MDKSMQKAATTNACEARRSFQSATSDLARHIGKLMAMKVLRQSPKNDCVSTSRSPVAGDDEAV
jgi:hypothetical protein